MCERTCFGGREGKGKGKERRGILGRFAVLNNVDRPTSLSSDLAAPQALNSANDVNSPRACPLQSLYQ